MQRLTREQFVARARKTHGDKYDYSKAEYVDTRTKVCITCRLHGDFFSSPANHMRGRGCPKCSGHHKRTNKEFIEDARKVHGNKYDYSKCNFIAVNDKVCIVCPIHGEFWQKPSEHLSGHGCFICGNSLKGDYARLTAEEFVRKARKIHGEKYNYSKAEYVNAQTKVCIACPVHGEFWQTPNSHLKGQGCPKCGREKSELSQRSTLDYVLAKFAATHGEEYDYSLVEYKGDSKKVKIICNKHGVFEQTPSHHIQGNGCPRCASSKGEKKIRAFLQEHEIAFIDQYKITTQITLWGKDECFWVDFFIPDKNLIIEFNGVQHYKMVDFFHSSDNGFEKQRARDKKLKKWCKDNNVKLLVIKYDQIDNIDIILKKKLLNKNGNEND